MIMGLSHFLPGGGCEFGGNPLESIYYIIEGEMDIEVEDGTKTTLHAGDSFHCGPFTKKGIQNNGAVTCQMLVCLVPPSRSKFPFRLPQPKGPHNIFERKSFT